jgi:hypothetical protein
MRVHIKNIVIWICALMTAATLGCSGGGSDEISPSVPDGTFTRTVELGNSPDWWAVIFDSSHSSMRGQHLYRAQDMDGEGFIDSLSFRYYEDESTAVTTANLTIKMGHTSVTELTGTFANNVEQGRGTLTEVLSHTTVMIPPGAAGDYFEIPLSKEFYYNGVDNLVVDISRDGICTGLVRMMTAQASTAYVATVTHPDDSGAVDSISQIHALPDAQFHFSGGSNRLEYGGSIIGNSCPFTTSPSLQKVQFLHNAADINGSGIITGLAMRVGQQTFSQEEYVFTMRLGHTTLHSLTTDFNGNFNGDPPVTVATSQVFIVPMDLLPGHYLWLPMSEGTFTYNGRDNLIVEIDVDSATGSTSWFQHESISGLYSRAWGPSGSSTAGARNTMQHQTKLRFRGDKISMNTPKGMSGGSAESFPFNTNDGKVQYLYLASELGTSGSISTLACRASSDSVNDSYNYTIRMGHTGATTLSTTFDDNPIDPVTVFNGTYSISSGLLKGDWFEIPLETSFSYTSRNNLVVEIGGVGGSGNACVVDTTSANLYGQRRLIGGSGDTTGSNTSAHMIDLQLTLQE